MQIVSWIFNFKKLKLKFNINDTAKKLMMQILKPVLLKAEH